MNQIKDKLSKQFHYEKTSDTYKIKVGGSYISNPRGKSSWGNLRSAKSALTCHYKYKISRLILDETGATRVQGLRGHYWYSAPDMNAAWVKFLKWAKKTKFIEFIKMS